MRMTKAELSRALDLYKYTTRLSLITAQAFRILAPNLSINSVASSRLREGFRDNHKRVYRLYREQGWSLRQKRPKRNKAAQLRQPKKLALHINQIWSMDFVADNLFDGRKLRMLTVVDCYTRESLDIHVDQSLKGEDVVRVLNNIVAARGKPMTIKTDNGSEFISKVMDKWAYERGIELDFSRPGKPTDNAMVESFNGRLRQECLNEHWFMSLQDARHKIEAWRSFYNE